MTVASCQRQRSSAVLKVRLHAPKVEMAKPPKRATAAKKKYLNQTTSRRRNDGPHGVILALTDIQTAGYVIILRAGGLEMVWDCFGCHSRRVSFHCKGFAGVAAQTCAGRDAGRQGRAGLHAIKNRGRQRGFVMMLVLPENLNRVDLP